MNEVLRPRPILASVICFYEVIMVFLALMGFAFAHAMRIANPLRIRVPDSPLRLTITWVGYALAIAIAVTLWQMRREAFYLAAGKLCLVLLGIGYSFAHPHVARVGRAGQTHVNMQALGAVGIIIIVISLSINAAITFYIQDITRPVWGIRR